MLKTINIEKPANSAEESIALAIKTNENSSFLKGMTEAFYAVGMLNDQQHSELASLVFEMTLQGR